MALHPNSAFVFVFALIISTVTVLPSMAPRASAATGAEILIESIEVVSDGSLNGQVIRGQKIQLVTSVSSNELSGEEYALVLDIRDSKGISVHIAFQQEPDRRDSMADIYQVWWTPDKDGAYEILGFLLSDISDSPKVLSPVFSRTITVGMTPSGSGENGDMSTTPEPDASEAMADYTVLVYMVGADLESDGYFATEEIQEMVSAFSKARPDEGMNGSDVNIVIETGGAADSPKNGNRTIDFTRVQRHEISRSGVTLLEDLGEKSMGEAQTLSDFLVFGVSKYPAKKYVLILWGHGGGVSGYGSDNISYDILTLPELEEAFSDAKSATGAVYELIGFDSCLMATFEVMSVLDDYGKYAVSSQELEPAWGWDYAALIGYLVDNPESSGLEVGRVVADSYKLHIEEKAGGYAKSSSIQDAITLSVVDLAKLDNVIENQTAFSKSLEKRVDSISAAQSFARTVIATERFAFEDEFSAGHMDLNHFAKNAEREFPEVAESARKLQTAIKEAVPYSISNALHADSSGISVYLPVSEDQDFEGLSDGQYLSPEWAQIAKRYSPFLYSDVAPPSGILQYDLKDKFYGSTSSQDAYRTRILVYKIVVENTAGEIVSVVDDYAALDSSGKFTIPFDSRFLSLCNGKECIPASMFAVNIAKTKYAIFPVRLESPTINSDVDLIYRINNDGNSTEYEFIGAWPGTDENGSASREMLPLKDGDIIYSKNERFDIRPSGEYNKVVESYSIVVNGSDFGPAYHKFDGTYYVAGAICDYVFNCLFSARDYKIVNRDAP